jgi:hypothetical protein
VDDVGLVDLAQTCHLGEVLAVVEHGDVDGVAGS